MNFGRRLVDPASRDSHPGVALPYQQPPCQHGFLLQLIACRAGVVAGFVKISRGAARLGQAALAPPPGAGRTAQWRALRLLISFGGALDFFASPLDVFAGAFNGIARGEQQGGSGTCECDSFAYHGEFLFSGDDGMQRTGHKQLSCQWSHHDQSPPRAVLRAAALRCPGKNYKRAG